MLHTKIIATLGPATQEKEVIKKMYAKGMRIVRLNFSHGDHTWARMIIRLVKELNEELPTPIGIMMDTKGPEIRTEDREDVLEVTKGMSLCFLPEGKKEQYKKVKTPLIGVDYKDIAKDIEKGDIMMIDGGRLRVKVKRVEPPLVYGKAMDDYELKSRRHVNLPGIAVRLPLLTKQDREDIKLGLREGVDFVALSFVSNKRDITLARKYMEKQRGSAQIIAKIENQRAIDNLEEIVDEADAVMIARGDLGVEAGFEMIPLLQEMIMTMATNHQKPCIMATDMLDSMKSNPTPTRAELSDVGSACFNMVDGIMLSAETSVGEYPVECVRMMHDIAKIVEGYNKKSYHGPMEMPVDHIFNGVISLGKSVKADLFLVLTNDEKVPRVLSWTRAHTPIVVLSKDKRMASAVTLYYGVEGYTVDLGKNKEERDKTIKEFLKKYDTKGAMKQVVVYTDPSIPYHTERTIELITIS